MFQFLERFYCELQRNCVKETFDVALSLWRDGKGDLVKEFVDFCRAYGIKPANKLSIGDFHSEKISNYAEYYLKPGTGDFTQL